MNHLTPKSDKMVLRLYEHDHFEWLYGIEFFFNCFLLFRCCSMTSGDCMKHNFNSEIIFLHFVERNQNSTPLNVLGSLYDNNWSDFIPELGLKSLKIKQRVCVSIPMRRSVGVIETPPIILIKREWSKVLKKYRNRKSCRRKIFLKRLLSSHNFHQL